MVREAAKGIVLVLAWEDVGASLLLAALLQILDHTDPEGVGN